ncbi:hypothetical protein TrRE_jg6998 [Triparma retinervis]|uniref:Vitamin K epoxide reductase domain-containing protein n=1 Tax=Triparma retinervis TaxID=2557542 RepID=A0A9W7DKV9_9STRA|nr:hypothetical protein TrRE_jg6998 [Triparma retinervis]
MSGPGGGCVTKVMQSPYSTIGPVPLCALGAIAYTVLLIASLTKSEPGHLLGKYLSASMAATSFALLYVLTVLSAPCPFCLVSAFCSVAISAQWWGRGGLGGLGLGLEPLKRTGFLAALGLAGGIAWTNIVDGGGVGAVTTPKPAYADPASVARGGQAAPPAATATATATATAATAATANPAAPASLLKDLKSLDTKLYGAFWCSHCAEQKEALGPSWRSYVEYVECDKGGEGFKGQCKIGVEKLKGYPTWTIDGIKIEGERTVEELQEIVKVIKDGGDASEL